MKLIYIINGLGFSKGMPPGGADKRAVEIGKILKEKGAEIFCLTTDAGEEVLKKEGFDVNYITFKRPKWWPKELENNLVGRMLSYFYVTIAERIKIKEILNELNNPISGVRYPTSVIFYPTSDMFFDVLPAWSLKHFLKGSRFVGIVHHWIPKDRPGSKFKNFILYLYQRFGFLVLKDSADLIVVPENPEGEKITKDLIDFGVNKEKINWFRNGADVTGIINTKTPKKEYEACFLGSIRPSKGIFDIPEIWKKVVNEIPDAKLLIVGGGLKQYQDELAEKIKESGLTKNIVVAGVVPQEDLYKIVKSAKVFISPSHEEGWGIVVGEALAAGLPVVAYELPAFKVYKDLIITVKMEDTKSFSKEIIRFLKDERKLKKVSERGIKGAEEFSWEKAAEKELGLLEKII